MTVIHSLKYRNRQSKLPSEKMLDFIFYGYILQAVGLVIGFLGALIIGLFEIKTKKDIQAEITNTTRNAKLERELTKSKRNGILLVILTISFLLQLIGLALSSV
jgi:hypothetical protein